jgi:hypothetical protein
MNDQVKIEVISELIKNTYEAMGMAVGEIKPCGVANFIVEIIDINGPREVLVNIFLQMININGTH